MSPRLSLALDAGGVALPDTGEIAVLHPRSGVDLSMLPKERTRIVQPFRPDHAYYAAQGFDCSPDFEGLSDRWQGAIVFLPRAKALAQVLVATALARTSGPVIIDGDKTDGVESLFRDLRKAGAVSEAISKAHGKIFWIDAPDSMDSPWPTPEAAKIDGFKTEPGVFSADGIDPGSAMLADCLPRKLGRTVVDLGAGWGYLSARALARDENIESIDLVEADYRALACARTNVANDKSRFHWADALSWNPEAKVDCVIMNPPFHQGRKADTELGRQFILAAQRALKPSGQLLMVANRHLAYEKTLSDAFGNVQEIGGDNRFKVLQASKPSTKKR
ncbi:MAG: methyltransferase [Arenibacterium sp.]